MKVFQVSFVVFLAFFGVIYIFSMGSGAPSIVEQDLPIWKAISGVLMAVLAFSFWVTMLVDCFSSAKTKHKAAWGLGLVFFSWVAAVLYFFMVYRNPPSPKG